MAEHLTREQISTLLEEPRMVPAGPVHLEECEECSREYERMSRMRMALSALSDLEPPPDEWERISDRMGFSQRHRWSVRLQWLQTAGWPLRAAAVLILFSGGLLVGQRLAVRPGGEAEDGWQAAQPATDGPGLFAVNQSRTEPEAAYLRNVAELQELRDQGVEGEGWMEDPAAVAERITRLDAIIEASREALSTAPADPVLNNFLFDLVDERNVLAGSLDRSLRMTAAEY
jgi:hypothetical protein